MLNSAHRPGYQQHVPAVARAVQALEQLAAGPSPRSLAELSRDLSVSPSSLLAILTTLRSARLVARDPDGRYRAGPGLPALGHCAARQLRAAVRFEALAEHLVERIGETVLLLVRDDDRYVLAAAREGTCPLRLVPPPAVRVSVDAIHAGTSDNGPIVAEILPDVWVVAVPLDAAGSALVAVAGAAARIVPDAIGPVLFEALGDAKDVVSVAPEVLAGDVGRLPSAPTPGRDAPIVTVADRAPSPLVDRAGPIEAAELDAFLRQSLVATLSYVAADGYPATIPLWYAWDGSAFWLAPRAGSEWAEHVRLDPRVSLAVSESTPPLRRVLARGTLVEVEPSDRQVLAVVEASFASRYAGFEAARDIFTAGGARTGLLVLEPERTIAWRGLLRHPHLPDPSDTQPETRANDAQRWRHLG
ncbi:MAG: helix-turn-helix domain-containing protein [Chloroflexi bacterium]|nr:helix-turn-helix domain-containing protein [Chloroflexota bacterium]